MNTATAFELTAMLEAELVGVGSNDFNNYLAKQRRLVQDALKCRNTIIPMVDLASMCKEMSALFGVTLKNNCCQEIMSLFPVEKSLLILKGWDDPVVKEAVRNVMSQFFLGMPWPSSIPIAGKRMVIFRKVLQEAINNYYLQ